MSSRYLFRTVLSVQKVCQIEINLLISWLQWTSLVSWTPPKTSWKRIFRDKMVTIYIAISFTSSFFYVAVVFYQAWVDELACIIDRLIVTQIPMMVMNAIRYRLKIFLEFVPRIGLSNFHAYPWDSPEPMFDKWTTSLILHRKKCENFIGWICRE